MTSIARNLAVIPAYNEAQTVRSVSESIHNELPEFDVLVIDDGSTDNTLSIATSLGLPVVRHPFNLGIGGAVQSGFLYASEHGYDYMVQIDADGQHCAGEVDKLLAAMHEDPTLDMVCGSRFLTDSGYPAPVSRRTGIHIFAFCCPASSGSA